MLFGEEPGQQVSDDLRHFKQVMETGEIVALRRDAAKRACSPAQPTASAGEARGTDRAIVRRRDARRLHDDSDGETR